MKCSGCGNELPSSGEVCRNCGNTPAFDPTYATPGVSSEFHQGETEAINLPRRNSQHLPHQRSPYPPAPSYEAFQHQPYNAQSGGPPSTAKLRRGPSHSTILVACICLVLVFIGAIGLSTMYVTSQHNRQKATQEPLHTYKTTVAMPTTTTAGMSATATPLTVPTTVPEAGFTWCGSDCAPDGFIDQFPVGWQASTLSGVTGFQFVNPQQPDQVAVFKRLDNPTATADQLLAGEIQAVYAGKPGYETPQPPAGQAATIGGETWSTASIAYMNNQTKEHVTICATVHQGKNFVLEFQAPDTQFAQVSTAYYNIMIGKFQFTQTGTP
ncbi:hypothetical protein [Dictyobacter halimunensis]